MAAQQAVQPESSQKGGANPKPNDTYDVTLIVALLGAGTSIVTLFVIGYQTLIFRGQHKIMDRQADIAERALIDVDRPFVFGEVSEPGFEIRWVEPIKAQTFSGRRLELRLFNLGHTPAILTRLEYDISAAQRGGIAPVIDPQITGGRELPMGIVITGDRVFTEGTLMNSVLTEPQKDAVANFRASVWIVGFVRYDDLLGGHYITGFTQVYDALGMRFVVRGDRAYNYARKEKGENIPPPSSRG